MLSNEEILAIWHDLPGDFPHPVTFAHAIEAALRAQADAKPAGVFDYQRGGKKSDELVIKWHGEAPRPGTMIYTHPAPEAAQALSELALDGLVNDCLKITEGKHHPFGKGSDTWDEMRRVVELVLTRASAATKPEGCDCDFDGAHSFDCPAATVAEPSDIERWKHVANEWADVATNGYQWLLNIQDGTSKVDDAIENMKDGLQHCRDTYDKTAAEQAKVDTERITFGRLPQHEHVAILKAFKASGLADTRDNRLAFMAAWKPAAQQQTEPLWDHKGNGCLDAVDRFAKAREQMRQIEKEHDAKSEFQREVENMGQRPGPEEGEILRLHTEMAGLRQMLDAANARADQAVALSNHLQDKLASQQAEPVGDVPECDGSHDYAEIRDGARECSACCPDERAEFEAWVSASGRAHLLGRDKTHGYYKDMTVTAWWAVWQARAAQSSQRAGVVQTAAARDVLTERGRQVSAEGWSPEHDDKHTNGQMAVAAGYYALACGFPHERDIGNGHLPNHWPWDAYWWKPRDHRRNLVRAGALILAEIERLDRAAAPTPAAQGGDSHG